MDASIRKYRLFFHQSLAFMYMYSLVVMLLENWIDKIICHNHAMHGVGQDGMKKIEDSKFHS